MFTLQQHAQSKGRDGETYLRGSAAERYEDEIGCVYAIDWTH